MNVRASWNNDKRNDITFLAKYLHVAEHVENRKTITAIHDDKCNIPQIRNTVPHLIMVSLARNYSI